MIVDSLAAALARREHEVEVVQLPLRSGWRDLPAQTLALRALDLTEAAGRPIDLVITIRYPSYAIRHPNKVVWFIHHHRGAYDLWGTEWQDIPNSPEGLRAREALVRSDTRYLSEAQRVYTISKTLAKRLKDGNGIDATGVLYHPLPNPDLYRRAEPSDYFLLSARLNPLKRQVLAIEAMRHVRSPFRLMLVGTGDVSTYQGELQALVDRHGLGDRVCLTGWVSEEEKAELTARAYAVLYVAYDEDSYGYSTLEGFHSGKPVLTCTDSGGTLEVIRDGVNGLVLPPEPRAIADGMERLWAQRQRAIEMGQNAYDTLRQHQINWDHVVGGLVHG